MKHSATAALLLGAVLCTFAPPAWGREVVLGLGETYSDGDLTVRCAERAEPQVIELTECQFWDQFDKVCLYERRTLRYGDLACVEECQQWDSFSNACYYAATCEFFPAQRSFVRTVCDVFDEVENVCRRTRQELLKDGYR